MVIWKRCEQRLFKNNVTITKLEALIMMKKVGVLGLAHGHIHAICDEWTNPEHQISVIAGWDHDQIRLQQAVEKYKLIAYDSPEQLLMNSNVDAVIITAETSRHADLVEMSAAAGKAIILYKPMSITMPEADRIVNAVNQHGVPFTMAWQMRVDPQNVKMKQLIESSELGRVLMVRRKHSLGMGLNADFANSWHVQPEENRDIWADDASHPIDFIHWLLGVPETITAEIESIYNPKIPMDNGVAIFKYKNGPIAEVTCSFTCPASENTTEIICEKGSIIQNYGDSTSCNVPRPEGAPGLKWFTKETNDWIVSPIPSPANHSMRIRGNAAPLAQFLHGSRPSLCTAEEGRTSLRMLLACYVSTREGRRVSIDDQAITGV
jgi:predicted dehydrogenase